ncbi:hypothetical protein, partial [Parasutterella excrementihominis]|uniref:hypothetical protein n=1 Tax=Parasutterella excrementihominis TaxID=487175 RepID=UPI003A929620
LEFLEEGGGLLLNFFHNFSLLEQRNFLNYAFKKSSKLRQRFILGVRWETRLYGQKFGIFFLIV